MKNIKNFFKSYWIGILIALTFFFVGLSTLSHYGINIDEPIHFERGNAYLDLFLTGRTKYTNADFQSPRVSEWKYKGYDADYFIKNDSGHPPLSGILAAATNRILYEKLGVMDDLEAYHAFELFISALLVFLVFAMIKRRYGTFAGTIACLSMALYPLFYGESHYNIKDPIEASFFAFTLYFLYLGVENLKAKYFFISSFFCALAFGTKFNIIFLPFIIIPYLFVRFGFSLNFKKIPKGVYVSLFLYTIIVLVIHFLSRPFLWQDPINRFLYIIAYYKNIGTGTNFEPMFLKYGWNTYPTFFVGISTPLVILILFIIGVLVVLFRIKKEKDKFSFLLLLWFGVTILRVSLPGTSIYGGVRQIMEYIPAMAGIAGLGALYIRGLLFKFINIKLASIIIFAAFVPLMATLVRLHPNENLFINSLVGGLKGATEKKIMGNAYLQGILWLNEHAEQGARFGFPVGLGSNFPPQFVRKDIKFGGHFSGMKRGGEYMIEMFSVEFPIHKYSYDYLDRFLIPVHVKAVDGVPILKIWKNDIAHTRTGFVNEIEEGRILVEKSGDGLSFSVKLKEPAFVTRIEINYSNDDCTREFNGDFSYSYDGDKEYLSPDESPLNQGRYVISLQTVNKLVYFFPAVKAKWVYVTPHDSNSCLLNVKNVRIFSLKDIKP
ncbi:MAG: glycosyltransferase family 39 protein [Candidatus Levybacteria bacterium]|nr:glycosyltransferase family 39 protein [Candidatus Levybacteria bacterium]